MVGSQSVNSSSLSGFYKFLQFHYIKISDVWKPRAVESTQEKFWAMIRDIGYNLNDAEMNRLLTLLGSNDGKICLRKLILLPVWSKCEQEIMGIIDKSTLKLVNLSKLAMKHQEKEKERDSRRRRSKKIEQLYSTLQTKQLTDSSMVGNKNNFPWLNSTVLNTSCSREGLQAKRLQEKINRNQSE